jgi:hypothetical protein
VPPDDDLRAVDVPLADDLGAVEVADDFRPEGRLAWVADFAGAFFLGAPLSWAGFSFAFAAGLRVRSLTSVTSSLVSSWRWPARRR